MEFRPTPLKGLTVVQLKLFGDARGFFVERFQADRFGAAGLPTHFPQDNHSRSAPGVIRGLHYQLNPTQGKLVGVMRGAIWDVAVDLRHDSPTFGQHFACELSDLNAQLLYVPPGFAHGFAVLGNESADVFYKVTSLYNPKGEGGVIYNDPELKIPWPIQNPTLSARDQALPPLSHYRQHPIRWA